MVPVVFSHAAAGWLALLALVVPLAIYLWNRRPGRVVRVGSVRWLEAAANRRLRSLRPEQLWLFLLRAALLALLALALAEPAQLLPTPPARGQVLLAPGLTTAALKPLRPALDSLRQRGYELRQLHAALPVGNPLPWASLGLGDTTAASAFQPDSVAAGNLWHLTQTAADSLPNRPLVVVTPLNLSSFSGTRPVLPAAVRWLPVPAPDSLRWALSAWQPHPDSLVVLVATGQETGIRFEKIRRPWPSESGPLPIGPGLVLRVEAGQHALYQGNRLLPLLTRAPHWHLSIDEAHAASGRVLLAALRAVGSVLPLPPRITVASTTPTDSLDWLFWLQDAPAPRLARTTRVWQEAPGTTAKADAAFQPPGFSQPTRIQRLDTSRQGAGPVWVTATGQAVLSQPTPTRYYLHTRLGAGWSELADSPALPALLLPLLHPISTAPSSPDSRLLPVAQLQGPQLQKPARGPAPTAPRRALAPWLVLAAGLLFVLERALASRRAAVSSPSLTS
ncbi:BatA domain-containing protein [Hymenobacter sp. UYP22]|uniref:BatA domain-containing protein n=1 Tax=Hymenobacter sp. UYP22 TaxID=3156348 RepID=UPI003392FF63